MAINIVWCRGGHLVLKAKPGWKEGGSWRWRGCWSCEGVSRLCGSRAAACATGSAVGTMRQALEATPSMGAGSSPLKGRRAPVVLSSARPAVATAASTAGFRSMRLHGITDLTRRRPSREQRGEVQGAPSLDLCSCNGKCSTIGLFLLCLRWQASRWMYRTLVIVCSVYTLIISYLQFLCLLHPCILTWVKYMRVQITYLFFPSEFSCGWN